MTAEEQRKLDEEREQLEDEYLLILLLLMGGIYEDALLSPTPIRVFRPLMFEQMVREVAESMADAHLAGYRLSLSGRLPAREELMRLYMRTAREAVSAMADTIEDAIAKAGGDVAQGLKDAGYTRSNSRGIELGAERNIVTAYNAGLVAGEIEAGGVTGLRHVSVIDGRETEICHERDALQLPISDPYWLTNWPSLHWSCRSLLEVIRGPFEPSAFRPVNPPMEGFGRAPLAVIPFLRAGALAA